MKISIILLILCAPLAAQQPRISNAKVETSAVSNLDAEFHRIAAMQNGPAWIGYAVPEIASHGDNGCGSMALEGHRGGLPNIPSHSATLLVLYRIAANAIDRIRFAPLDCAIDGGGLPFFWLTGVRSAESIRLLSSVATQHGDAAISAIAQHDDPAADQALENLVAPAQPEKTRERALFWLGAVRGRHGYEVVKRIATGDQSDHIREKAMFSLSMSKEPEAVGVLVAAAKNDKSPRVRGQALFWLAQKAGKKETAAITDAIRNDPDTQVKKQAVFALQQLPKDEGVPLLIEVARTNKNPEVRKQAMFWLGQSKDLRAATFFEEVLK